MDDFGLSRREMLVAGGVSAALAATGSAASETPLTATDVIARVKAHVGIPWRTETVDRIIAGDPMTPVKGIATTVMATFDALKAAVAANKNMVITHESTFWSHQDDVSQLQTDPLYLQKLAYIKQNNLVSFHFHDHWHGLKPIDGIMVGVMRKLGWDRYVDAGNPRKFTLPRTTLLDLARELQTKLGNRTIRVVGDPQLPVARVLTSWGFASPFPGIPQINDDEDVFVIGETREWEMVEYAQDLVATGKKKGLIMLGHARSEQWGMKYCAEWLRPIVPEVPVEFIPVVEPFWNPEHPAMEINTRA